MLIQGTAKWAKVTEGPAWGYQNAHKEWSIDVYLDEDNVKAVVEEGLKSVIKDKGEGPYMTFKRKELKQDGTPNKPIRVVDHKGEAWNGKKIGNGSIVNVNFAKNEWGEGKAKKVSANILSLQVWKLAEYNGGNEFPTRDDDAAQDGDSEAW